MEDLRAKLFVHHDCVASFQHGVWSFKIRKGGKQRGRGRDAEGTSRVCACV